MRAFTFKMQDDGKLPPGIRESLQNIFPSFAGKTIRLKIEEAKERRSLSQNDMYWAAIVPHVRKVRFENGDPQSIEQVHEDLLSQFAPAVKCTRLDGSIYTRPMRSKEMSVKEMADYITSIIAFMSSFGSPIPMRDDYAA